MRAKLITLGIVLASGINAFASGSPAVVVPTPDYTTFYSVVGVGLGVALIVGLAFKAKSFIR